MANEQKQAAVAVKHISGPWKVCDRAPNDLWFIGRTIGLDLPGGRRIADVTGSNPEDLANAQLIATSPDHALLLSTICAGKARWEQFPGSATNGEVCVNGLRYAVELDDFGCPILYPHLREVLAKAVRS